MDEVAEGVGQIGVVTEHERVLREGEVLRGAPALGARVCGVARRVGGGA